MKQSLLERLRCPESSEPLIFQEGIGEGIHSLDLMSETEYVDGWLVSEGRGFRYPVKNGIPRLVPEVNYADNFGTQWNVFAKAQLDSYSGHSSSADRFWKATCWIPEDLKDSSVPDVGCGSGRFAEVALSAGANVAALDYSSAVDACQANLGDNVNLHVVQGDIYKLPFASDSFSFVYSLGVLQHTPDVISAFAALPRVTKSGGFLCVDYYEKSFRSYFLPKYWLRHVTKHFPDTKLLSALEVIVPALLPISRALNRIPIFGKYLQRIIPVANHEDLLPLTEEQLIEWSLLDTFDWFAPAFDNPQTRKSALQFMKDAKMKNIEVLRAGHLVARGQKPDLDQSE